MADISNIDIIKDLLTEFKVHRDAISSMIKDVEHLKATVDKLFPKELDARTARYLDDKIKTATELFKTLLEMRKEIQKSLKEEIELRRKVSFDDSDGNIEELLDVRDIVETLEEFKNKRKKLKEKSIEKARKDTDYIANEVVTVQHSN